MRPRTRDSCCPRTTNPPPPGQPWRPFRPFSKPRATPLGATRLSTPDPTHYRPGNPFSPGNIPRLQLPDAVGHRAVAHHRRGGGTRRRRRGLVLARRRPSLARRPMTAHHHTRPWKRRRTIYQSSFRHQWRTRPLPSDHSNRKPNAGCSRRADDPAREGRHCRPGNGCPRVG